MDDIDKFRKEIINSDSFCFYPFLNISTRPNGAVDPCCYYSEEADLVLSDKISSNNKIQNFWNDKKIIQIRNTISKGEQLSGCKVCYRDGPASMRVRSIKENINNKEYLKLVKSVIDNNGVAEYTPRMLELKPSNLCNLKCIMCNAYDSSQVEKELRELDHKFNGIKAKGGRFLHAVSGNPGVWEGPVNEYTLPNMLDLDWAETGEFWKELEEIIPNLNILSFAGGEPTVNPVVYKILNYCVENGYSKNITVFISSNFTNLNKKFFDVMPLFKKFELIASIDGTGPVLEYVRFPSKWNVIKNNFEVARNYMKYDNVKILVNITVNMLNVFYLTDLLDYLETQFFEYPYYKEWPYNINLLYYPEELRIDFIPPDLRDPIIEKIYNYQNTSQVLKYFPDLKIKTDLIVDVLKKDFDPIEAKFHLERLYTILTTLDEHRNLSYKHSVPFVNDILNCKNKL